MSNKKRPTNELDPVYKRRLFQLLRSDTILFKGWAKDEINALADLAVVLKMFPNDRLVRRGEKVEWLGIILSGEALVTVEFLSLGRLSVGDMIGYMGSLKLEGNETHKFDVVTTVEGYLAVIFADDIGNLSRKVPRMATKFYEALVYKTLNVISFQYFGNTFYSPTRFTTEEFTLKRISDMLSRVPEYNLKVLSALDRMEQKVFLSACKFVRFTPNMLIYSPNALESSVIFLTNGDLAEFRPNETYLYRTGDILGLSNFINSGALTAWRYEVRAVGFGGLVLFNREYFNDIAIASPTYAIKIYTLIAKLLCEQISKSKTIPFNLPVSERRRSVLSLDTMSLTKSNFIELDTTKLRERRENLSSIQSLSQKSIPPSIVEGKSSLPSIREDPEESKRDVFFDYNLSEEFPPLYVFSRFRDYLVEPMQPVDRPEMLGSLLIAEKMEKQRLEAEEAKKHKRTGTKRTVGRGSSRSVSPRRGKNTGRDMKAEMARTEGIVIDLKEEYIEMEAENKAMNLQVRQLLKEKEQLLKQTAVLNQQLTKEKLERERLQVMLHKYAMHRELDKSQSSKDSRRMMSQQVNLSFNDVLNEQMKNYSKFFVVAKFAFRWLDTVRSRKALRELKEKQRFWPTD